MRAPMQVLVLPYTIQDRMPLFCILKRADNQSWQFVAGGGEDNETPKQAASRELFEEIGIDTKPDLYQLKFMTYVPANCFAECHRKNWGNETIILPEYSFAVRIDTNNVILSTEHTEFRWVSFDEAQSSLHWQSNGVALYELNERIKLNTF